MADTRTVAEVDTGMQQSGQTSIITPAAAVELSSPLRLDQLTAELADRVHLSANGLVLSTNGDTMAAGADTPVYLWTDTTGVSADGLLAAAVAHVPNPTWNPDAPPGGMTADELRDKAAGGALLSTDEVQLALRYLLSTAYPP